MEPEINHDLKLGLEYRHLFAKPLDILIAGNRQDTIPQVKNLLKDYLKKHKKIHYYLVGDIVTEDFLSHPFLTKHIKLCILDEKTQRSRISLNPTFQFQHIFELENPAGLISKESWTVIQEALELEGSSVIKITEGEEDLLLIPLVLLLPIKENETHFVFYGQPPITDADFTIPQGIVVVKVDKKIQDKVKKLLGYLDKV